MPATKAIPSGVRHYSHDQMRELSRQFLPWIEQFRSLLLEQKGRFDLIAKKAGVSGLRLGRYRRGEIKWLSVPEYLRVYCAITNYDIPDLEDDAVRPPDGLSRWTEDRKKAESERALARHAAKGTRRGPSKPAKPKPKSPLADAILE
jgi:hypothetical protein